MDSPHVTFFLCISVIISYIALILSHKTILMGFVFMAALQIYIQTLSLFVITYIFDLGLEYFGPPHYFVYNYMSFGLIAMAAGVWIAWKPIRENEPMVNPFLAETKFVNLFALVGASAFLAVVIIPRIPTVSAVIQKFYMFLPLSVVAGVLVWSATRNLKPVLFSICVFVPSGVLHMATSGHAALLGSFLLHPMLVFCFWRRPKIRHFILMGAWISFFFVVGGVWLNARLLLRDGEVKGNAIEKVIKFFPQFMGQIFSAESLKAENIRAAAEQRLDLSSFQVAQSVYMPSGRDYEWGKGLFLDPFLAIVPRILWPNKPFTMGDNEHINKYTGARFNQDDISVDSIIAFDLYANFAWPGVIVGLFFYGYFTAKLELKLFKPGISLRNVLLFSIVLLYLATGGRRVSAMAMELAASVVGALLLAEFLKVTGLFRTRFTEKAHFSMFKVKPKQRRLL